MRAVPLGTSAGRPTAERNVSSTALVLDGEVVLFDCGEATQLRLMAAGLRLSRIAVICISHLHGDHVNGLPGLVGTESLNGRTAPLTLLGPPELGEYWDSLRRLSVLRPEFPVEVLALQDGDAPLRRPGFTLRWRALDHRVPAFGYALQQDDRPGHMDAEKALASGVPHGPLLGRLKAGHDVVLENGETIHARDVTGPPIRGERFAYCTDTRPCVATVELARGADLLVHEATYLHDRALDADQRGHSTARQAAEIARDAGVKRLCITHFSARHPVAALLAEARAVFPETVAAEELVPILVQ